MCFVWIWEQTAIISLYINWLVLITERVCVYCAVRSGSLYIIQVVCFVWIWKQTATISLDNNWLVFNTENECVYCAVRTDSSNVILMVLPRNWAIYSSSLLLCLVPWLSRGHYRHPVNTICLVLLQSNQCQCFSSPLWRSGRMAMRRIRIVPSLAPKQFSVVGL
jgi:hypothetical protein